VGERDRALGPNLTIGSKLIEKRLNAQNLADLAQQLRSEDDDDFDVESSPRRPNVDARYRSPVSASLNHQHCRQRDDRYSSDEDRVFEQWGVKAVGEV
jgi:hypothetical protein